MAEYILFDQDVFFMESAERFFDMQNRGIFAAVEASLDFDVWYDNCGDILTVLKGYQKEAMSLIVKYANEPLFNEITDCGIYDMSEDKYDDECLLCDESDNALDLVADKYNKIVAEQEAEEEYRAERKANRARVVGGGFGVSGAIQGMATAGAMNAVSGLGHGIINAIGNAGSAMAAASSKRALYNNENTRLLLRGAVEQDIFNCYVAHMALVNKRIKFYFSDIFDLDKGKALFQNAKKVPEKRKQLLVESFENYPWNKDLLIYIFKEFPSERTNVWKAAKRFEVKLDDVAEQIFAASYTEQAKNSEELAQKVKKDILTQMKEIGISSSATVDQIETDGVTRLLQAYTGEYTADKDKIFADLESYDASLPIKVKVIHDLRIWELTKKYSVQYTNDEIDEILGNYFTKEDMASEEKAMKARPKLLQVMEALCVTESRILDRLEGFCLDTLCGNYQNADEVICNELKEKIEAYEAQRKNKDLYLKKVQDRIETIWAMEDGIIFDNIYLNTNIHDPEDVTRAFRYIKEKSRTDDAQKYLNALMFCDEDHLRSARRSQSSFRKFLNIFGYILLVVAVICLFAGAGLLLSIAIGVVGLVLVSNYMELNRWYNILTIDGTVKHPLLLLDSSQVAKTAPPAGTNHASEAPPDDSPL